MNYLDVSFVDVLESWLFATQTFSTTAAFKSVDELWEARVPDYTNDVLVQGCRSKRASNLGLAADNENIRVTILERAVSGCKNL